MAAQTHNMNRDPLDLTDEATISNYLESNPGHDPAACSVRVGTINGVSWVRCLSHKSAWVSAGER